MLYRRYSAILIYMLAFSIRVFYNGSAAKGYYPSHDSAKYQAIALNMVRSSCYCLIPHTPTLDRAPFWPSIIAIIYTIFGQNNSFVRLFLCALGAGTCVLIYLFARDIFGMHTGIFSGCMAAFYPFLFIYDGWLYSESLYTFLLFALCYTLYRLLRGPSMLSMCLSSLLLSALALTRPNGLLLLSVFILWIVIMGYTKLLRWRVVLKSVLIVSLLVTLLVLPWTLRNYSVTHRLVFVASGDGTVLLGAYNDKVVGTWYENGFYQGTWVAPEEAMPTVTTRFAGRCQNTCEVERDDTYRQYAWKWIQGHVSDMPSLLGQHFVNLWQITSKEADLPINVYPTRTSSHIITTMMITTAPIIFVFAAWGLLVTRCYWRELLFIYLVIVFTVAQSTVLYGISRFRAPLEPMLILLSAAAIQWLIKAIVLASTRSLYLRQGKYGE